MPSLPDNGMIHLTSPYSVAETITRLEALLKAQGLTEFCRIDHSGEAEKAGLKMPPTLVLIFGSPKGGTPLMIASPTIAIRDIYLTPPSATGCGLIRVAKGAGPTCTTCWARR